MIYISISRRLNKLKANEPAGNPRSQKQIYASIYRESQIQICADYARLLKGFMRSLVWPNANTRSNLRTRGVSLLDLRTLHNVLYGNGTIDDEFLDGIEANTNSRDFDTLWLAGWDEDLFVLLLCFALLSPSLQSSDASWQREAFEDYMPLVASSRLSQSQLGGAEESQEVENAEELLELVRHAAVVCGKTSVWADERWRVEFIQRVGRQAIERDSFQLMHEVPEAAREGAGGAHETMRCYICFYFGKFT
jgi:hypothetical protein